MDCFTSSLSLCKKEKKAQYFEGLIVELKLNFVLMYCIPLIAGCVDETENELCEV